MAQAIDQAAATVGVDFLGGYSALVHKGATRSEFQAYAKQKGASDLMIPAEVVVLDKLPVLGTGKIDMVGVAKLVKERAAAAPATEPVVA